MAKTFYCLTRLELPIKEPHVPQQLGRRSACGSITNLGAALHNPNQQVAPSCRPLCRFGGEQAELGALNSINCDYLHRSANDFRSEVGEADNGTFFFFDPIST